MINSTFGSFMTARLGMSASQKALSVVGQNIANISTPGYTRQRLDQVSLNVGGGSNKYSSKYLTNIGNGVFVTGVSQLRDPFLDKRFRTEMAQVGEYDIWTSGLGEIADIIDETSMKEEGGGINNQLSDIITRLNNLAENVGSKEFDNMVKSSADVLVKLFNSYAKQLETIRGNQETDLKDVDIPAVNKILTSIQELNVSIKNSQIHGDDALELQDQRNSLIDELSTYVNIEVSYKPIQISDSTVVDELTIRLVGANEKIDLINDEQARQLTAEKDDATGQWNISLTELSPENTELQIAIDNAQKLLDKETAAAGNAQIDMNNAQTALDDLKQLLSDANQKVTDAGNAVATAQGDVTTAQEAYDKAKEAAAADPSDSDLAEAVTQAKETLDAKKDALKEAQKTQREAESEQRSLQTQTDKAQQTLDKATNKYNELVANEAERIDAAQKNLDEKIKEKADAEAAGVARTNINGELTTGSLKGSLDLLNNNGEFDNPATSKGIGYYQKALDLLANKFATSFNDANNTAGYTDHDLFATNDGTTVITAKNIKIADGWANNQYGITASQDADAPVGANDNISHMITMMKESMKYSTGGANDVQIFEGSFQEYFVNMGTQLGLDINSSTEILNNHTSLASSINDDRDNVSGVSLDEEGMNMIQFSQAYNASARLMTVLDEALDTLINNMGVVGR